MMIRWAALIKPWGEQKGRVNPKLLHVYTKPAHTRYNLGGVTAAGRHTTATTQHTQQSACIKGPRGNVAKRQMRHKHERTFVVLKSREATGGRGVSSSV